MSLIFVCNSLIVLSSDIHTELCLQLHITITKSYFLDQYSPNYDIFNNEEYVPFMTVIITRVCFEEWASIFRENFLL